MFSVVIPLFDKAPFIGRALASVHAQGETPAEIIVVNDGSADGGERIAAADPRVRVIDQPNRGVSAARNAGWAAATQPYVAFLDADDRWRPEFLGRMREAIRRHPAAVLVAAGFVTVRDGREQRRIGIPPGPGRDPSARAVDYFAVSTGGHPLHMSTTVVRAEVARAVGGFAEGVAFCEDHLFWAQLALVGEVVLTPEVLAEYDVAVPGQAVERWRVAYRQQVLAYHRFLADEFSLLAGATHGSPSTPGRRGATAAREPMIPCSSGPPGRTWSASFLGHCRREFRVALWQRLYWGECAALREFWRELRLAELPVGPAAAVCGWIADHPALDPLVRLVTRLVRTVREPWRRPSW